MAAFESSRNLGLYVHILRGRKLAVVRMPTEYYAISITRIDTGKMEPLRRLLGASSARKPPQAVETDDIYPVHMLDDTKSLRDIVVTWTLRFNDVLDADKLHVSLSRLLEIGDWRKVGGRLRLNVRTCPFFGVTTGCRPVNFSRTTDRIMGSWKFMSPGPSLLNVPLCSTPTKPWT